MDKKVGNVTQKGAFCFIDNNKTECKIKSHYQIIKIIIERLFTTKITER